MKKFKQNQSKLFFNKLEVLDYNTLKNIIGGTLSKAPLGTWPTHTGQSY